MKLWQYMTAFGLAVVCLGLSVAAVLTAMANQQLQQKLQAQQLRINSGILGQRGQAISGQILQEMANVAAQNPSMRRLLSRHGYTVKTEGGGSTVEAPPAPAPRKGGADEGE